MKGAQHYAPLPVRGEGRREASRGIAGLTSGGGLRGKGHPDLDTVLAVESGRERLDFGLPLGQVLTAPPPAGAESNSYKRRDRLRLGESQGPSLNSSRPHSPAWRCPPRSSARSMRPGLSAGRTKRTSSQSPAVLGGRGALSGGPGSWRGANWESGVVCWLRPLPEGGGEPYISAVVALDVLFRNGFAVRTQVSGGCGFRGPATPAFSGPGQRAGVPPPGFAASIPTPGGGLCGRQSVRPKRHPRSLASCQA